MVALRLLAVLLCWLEINGREYKSFQPVSVERQHLLRRMRERYFIQLRSTNRNKWKREDREGLASNKPTAWPLNETVYVIPDLHGDFLVTEALLRSMNLVDSSGQWIGVKARLIQLGDIADRGPDSPAIYEWFWYMREQSKQSQCAIIQLLGNHEVMNLMNMTHYLSPDEISYYYKSNDIDGLKDVDPEAVWNPNTGYLGSRILSSFDLIYRLGDVVFVHGGLTKKYSGKNEGRLTYDLVKSIKDYALGDATYASKYHELIEGKQSPIWTRLLSTKTEDPSACKRLKESQSVGGEYNVQVVGHTPTVSGRVEVRCNNKYIMADTGSSRWMHGTPTSIRIRTSHKKLLHDVKRRLYTTQRHWEELIVENVGQSDNVKYHYKQLFTDWVCYLDPEGKIQVFNCSNNINHDTLDELR